MPQVLPLLVDTKGRPVYVSACRFYIFYRGYTRLWKKREAMNPVLGGDQPVARRPG